MTGRDAADAAARMCRDLIDTGVGCPCNKPEHRCGRNQREDDLKAIQQALRNGGSVLGSPVGTVEHQLECCRENNRILEANAKVDARAEYLNGREDERRAIASYLASCGLGSEAEAVREKRHVRKSSTA